MGVDYLLLGVPWNFSLHSSPDAVIRGVAAFSSPCVMQALYPPASLKCCDPFIFISNWGSHISHAQQHTWSVATVLDNTVLEC